MWLDVFFGVMIPFLGTTGGALCVFLLRKNLSGRAECILSGFAGGVMVAASFFSLILPAIEGACDMGRLAFLPASIGFFTGVLFLILIDRIMPYIGFDHIKKEKNLKLVLAVTVHNLPEGMAVGIAYAGVLYGKNGISVMSAFALAVGIALQNFPEGAIVSMPLNACGISKPKSFLLGALSGIVEPIGAAVAMIASAGISLLIMALYGQRTLPKDLASLDVIAVIIFAAGFFVPLMPYFLSFAAGAMFYVVIEELLPHSDGEKVSVGTLSFALGFIVMMALDVGMR